MAINPMADADAEAPKPSKLAKAASIFDIVGNIGGLGLKGMDMYKMSSAGKIAGSKPGDYTTPFKDIA